MQAYKRNMSPICEYLPVLDVERRQPDFLFLRLGSPSWREWNPGQFVMLRPESFGLEMPLARPFCICRMTGRKLVCFIRAVGKGTAKIASLRAGDKIMAWGPLGNYFAVEKDTPTLILAGGMGIAPFVGYVNRHPQPDNVSMLFGHRDPLECFPVEDIQKHCAVDSMREQAPGDLDKFIQTMEERILHFSQRGALILACGPDPFLRTAQKIALKYGARMQISLERRMACGVGACLGCVARPAGKTLDAADNDNPIQTCVHGPIFWADKIEI